MMSTASPSRSRDAFRSSSVAPASNGRSKIVAQYADEWCSECLSVEDYARKVAVLERHCESVSRDPASIRRSMVVTGDFVPTGRKFFRGTAKQVLHASKIRPIAAEELQCPAEDGGFRASGVASRSSMSSPNTPALDCRRRSFGATILRQTSSRNTLRRKSCRRSGTSEVTEALPSTPELASPVHRFRSPPGGTWSADRHHVGSNQRAR